MEDQVVSVVIRGLGQSYCQGTHGGVGGVNASLNEGDGIKGTGHSSQETGHTVAREERERTRQRDYARLYLVGVQVVMLIDASCCLFVCERV